MLPRAFSEPSARRRNARPSLLVIALAMCALHTTASHAVVVAPPPSELQFFKNYFITGDYVVGGVGLLGQGDVNGIATGEIEIKGVPDRADIVAAFLYWQVETEGGPDSGSLPVTFNGYPLKSADGPFGKVLGAAAAPCWSAGARSSGGASTTYSYRADVLRFFDIDEETGKFRVNGPHQVQLPDGGVPAALGASLVVIYRDSLLPLSAIVLYDGDRTPSQNPQSMATNLQGFYQAASPTVSAQLTLIVGSGQAAKSERLLVNGHEIAVNPFASELGNYWDSPTFDLSDLRGLAGSAQLPISVDPVWAGAEGPDCLTWSAIVFRTTVQDTDGDGLLDVWETSAGTLSDPEGQSLPDLAAMGADPNRKDIFVEVGYMKADAPLTYGGVSKPAHTHLPSPEVFKMVGEAFAARGIAMHFDVGANYHDPDGIATPYLVAAKHARGGEAIDETDTVCVEARDPLDPPWVCQFSEYPGTVGWKTGFKFLRDQVLSGGDQWLPGEEDPCDTPGACERRFDRNRKDMFRYALFAHAIGLPKSEEPCLDAEGTPVQAVNGACAAPLSDNPEFHVPRTNTGVGDFPGGDVMITLGGFNSTSNLPVGTPFMQASTLMHELGHNFGLRHGGGPLEANCKPDYLSVMNYLYQLRGLKDEAGRPNLDFSGDNHSGLDVNEGALPYGATFSSLYLIGWYAPLEGSVFDGPSGPRAPIAARRCDGSTPPAGEVLPRMVRVDQRRVTDGIDWDADGDLGTKPSPIDVNFNGSLDDDLRSSDDWSNLVLNQAGGRRNTGGLFVIDAAGRLALGPLSLDAGRGDLGRGDLGRGDLGRGDLGGDLGRGDLGRGDLGRGDLGRGDLGRGDLGRGDLGRGDLGMAMGRGDLGRGDLGGGDLFVGDPDGGGELDVETAGELANTPPNEFRACVVGTDGCTADGALQHQVRLDWTAPNVGGVSQYLVYRVAGAELLPGLVWTPVAGPVESQLGQVDYFLIDAASLDNGAFYTYFTVARYADGIQSDPSNLVTITAVNDAPVVTGLADVTIDQGSSTTLSFTIADESAAGVTLSGMSSNTALVPGASIVFGGSGEQRSVTVTPAAGQSGAATITVTVTDAGGRASSASFALTVREAGYRFHGVWNAPPLAGRTFKAGAIIPILWQYRSGPTTVASSQASPTVTVRGPLPGGPTRVFTGTDPGWDFFYAAIFKTWTFVLPTREDRGVKYSPGIYEVIVTTSSPRYLPSPAFQITLK